MVDLESKMKCVYWTLILCKELVLFKLFLPMYILIPQKCTFDRLTVWLSPVNFVLTSVNSEFTGVSMEIITWGLAEVILISDSDRNSIAISL